MILAREKEVRWRCMLCPIGYVMMHFKLTEKELKMLTPKLRPDLGDGRIGLLTTV